MTPEALAKLHAVCFDIPPPWSARDFSSLLTDASCIVYTHASEQDLLAFVIFRVAADEAELLTLATAPDARRMGLARTLIQKGLLEAARRGATQCFLEVAETNLPARRLYSSFGFVEIATRRGYYHANGKSYDAVICKAKL